MDGRMHYYHCRWQLFAEMQTLVEKRNQEREAGSGEGKWQRQKELVSELLHIFLMLLVSRAFGHLFLSSSCFSKLFLSARQIQLASTLPHVPATLPLIPHPSGGSEMLLCIKTHDSPHGSRTHEYATPENWEQLLPGANLLPIGCGSWQINSYPLSPTDGLYEDETIHIAPWKIRDQVIKHAEYQAVVCWLKHYGYTLSFSLPHSLVPSSCFPCIILYCIYCARRQ